jgi:hypothetical protein
MKIEINPGDRQLAFIILFAAMVIAISAATAYTANAPSDPTGTQPAAVGHSADEIDTRPLYIDTTTTRIGIDIPVPSQALDVAGNIQATGDICTGAGNCLNSVGGGPRNCVWVAANRFGANTRAGFYIAGLSLGGCGRGGTAGCVNSIYWCQ